jgi:N12 class adenine-specific DNA methylase
VKSALTTSGKKRVINKAETLLALEKQKKLIDEFKAWVWKDLRRMNRLKEIYNEKYCSNVIRRYDGSFLRFP